MVGMEYNSDFGGSSCDRFSLKCTRILFRTLNECGNDPEPDDEEGPARPIVRILNFGPVATFMLRGDGAASMETVTGMSTQPMRLAVPVVEEQNFEHHL